MVKKKGKSKRTTLKDKYKMQKRTVETKRKLKKQAKRDAKNGIVRPSQFKKKDPGIPNSWPFKQDLLKEIQRSREKQQQAKEERNTRRKQDLQALREHQQGGGTARTVEELMARAAQDRSEFEANDNIVASAATSTKSDGTVAAGQQSRRAYLREMKKVVDTSDVLLQVLDARDPISSRIHPTLEDAILSRSDKRMVLVLNKIDLVPKAVVGRWLTVLRRSHPTIAIKAGKNENKGGDGQQDSATQSNVPVGMEGLLQLLKNYARTGGSGGKSKTTIVVGIIGYPNVGKSSIINALKRARAVGVSSKPGFTTSMQEVVLDRNVRLLDSPGVVFDDDTALLGNCVHADTIDDPIPAVDALLKRCTQQSVMMTYNIPAFPPGNTMMFLAMVARSHGRVLKGGIPDKIGAARAVLKDWNSGKIPYYTVPPANNDDNGDTENAKGNAVIVTEFGAEFDLSKFDDEVLNTLNDDGDDNDEMDYIQIQEDTNRKSAALGQESHRLAKFLKSGKGDDDDDDEMEEDDDDDDDDDDLDEEEEEEEMDNDHLNVAGVARAKLVQAEDFNFDDL